MRIVLATHNADKVREIRGILAGLDVEIVSLDSFPDAPVPVEDADTLEGNALKKAREIRDFTGTSALADDTGLEVDALGGAPGVYAARYAGENATYADNCDKLLREMDGAPTELRTARFRTVVALALAPDAVPRGHDATLADALTAEGILHGRIARSARGREGFGYDPVFVHDESGKTLAEMTPQEKNSCSHRYRALLEMREMLLRLGVAREV